MNELEVIGVGLVAILVVVGAVWSFIISPSGPFGDGWRKEVRELEVRSRMDTGEQLIEDLRAIAKLYRKLGKRWEAEQALRRATVIAKQQWGEYNSQLIDVLDEYATLMSSMHRKKESANVRKQITEIRKKLS